MPYKLEIATVSEPTLKMLSTREYLRLTLLCYTTHMRHININMKGLIYDTTMSLQAQVIFRVLLSKC